MGRLEMVWTKLEKAQDHVMWHDVVTYASVRVERLLLCAMLVG